MVKDVCEQNGYRNIKVKYSRDSMTMLALLIQFDEIFEVGRKASDNESGGGEIALPYKWKYNCAMCWCKRHQPIYSSMTSAFFRLGKNIIPITNEIAATMMGYHSPANGSPEGNEAFLLFSYR